MDIKPTTFMRRYHVHVSLYALRLFDEFKRVYCNECAKLSDQWS
jgi:RNase P subunit RPR2